MLPVPRVDFIVINPKVEDKNRFVCKSNKCDEVINTKLRLGQVNVNEVLFRSGRHA